MEMAASLALMPWEAGAEQDAGLRAWEGRCHVSIPQGEPQWDTAAGQPSLVLLPAVQRSPHTHMEILEGVLGIQFTFPGVWHGDEPPKASFSHCQSTVFPSRDHCLCVPSKAKFSWGLRADTCCFRRAGFRDVSPGLVHRPLHREQSPSPQPGWFWGTSPALLCCSKAPTSPLMKTQGCSKLAPGSKIWAPHHPWGNASSSWRCPLCW